MIIIPLTSKISSKGQVTIPKEIRDMLELKDGDRIKFIKENGRIYIGKAVQMVVSDFPEKRGE